MIMTSLQKDDPAYPAALRTYLGDRAPERLFLLGNAELLDRELLALFCSIKCPGSIILKTYDLARELRNKGITVIGGFHTPMEKECLDILLRGTQPVILCPARSIENIRLSSTLKEGIELGRILLISMFGTGHRRATAELADKRNYLIAALAAKVFVSHASPNGKTEALCRDVIAMGKPLLTVNAPENANLLDIGATQFQFV